MQNLDQDPTLGPLTDTDYFLPPTPGAPDMGFSQANVTVCFTDDDFENTTRSHDDCDPSYQWTSGEEQDFSSFLNLDAYVNDSRDSAAFSRAPTPAPVSQNLSNLADFSSSTLYNEASIEPSASFDSLPSSGNVSNVSPPLRTPEEVDPRVSPHQFGGLKNDVSMVPLQPAWEQIQSIRVASHDPALLRQVSEFEGEQEGQDQSETSEVTVVQPQYLQPNADMLPSQATQLNMNLQELHAEIFKILQNAIPGSATATLEGDNPALAVVAGSALASIDPQQLHPQHVDPQHVDPQHVHPQHVQPQHVQPQHVHPQHVHPQHVHPQQVHPQDVQPQYVHPQQLQPQQLYNQTSDPGFRCPTFTPLPPSEIHPTFTSEGGPGRSEDKPINWPTLQLLHTGGVSGWSTIAVSGSGNSRRSNGSPAQRVRTAAESHVGPHRRAPTLVLGAGATSCHPTRNESGNKTETAVTANGKGGDRVNIACHFCKKRKMKCSGPVTAGPDSRCLKCIGRDHKCCFDSEVRRRGPAKKHSSDQFRSRSHSTVAARKGSKAGNDTDDASATRSATF
ncbi:unnamed protein product [Parajaminaea phylloscopi]